MTIDFFNGTEAHHHRAGAILRRAATFLELLGDAHRSEALDLIGAQLREIQTLEIYLDGGRSQQGVIDDLQSANASCRNG